jgi:hypothetical protein
LEVQDIILNEWIGEQCSDRKEKTEEVALPDEHQK